MNEQECLKEIMVNTVVWKHGVNKDNYLKDFYEMPILEYIIAIIDNGNNQIGSIHAKVDEVDNKEVFMREMFKVHPDITVKYDSERKYTYRLYIGRHYVEDSNCPYTLQDIAAELRYYLRYSIFKYNSDDLYDKSLKELIVLFKEAKKDE